MKSTRPTLISVGLPVYNGSKTIERALQSLADQIYPNIEVVICDDVSTDNTAETCMRFANIYPWMRFERNVTNLGAHHNMMKTLSLSTGKYFLWADQEDYWAPGFIAALVAEFERDPDVSGAMSGTRMVYEDGTEARVVRAVDVEMPQERSHLANALSVVTKRANTLPKSHINLFIHGLVRRRDFLKAHEAYPGVPLSERQIVCQLALAGRLVFVDEVLFVQTAHRTSIDMRRPATEPLVAARSRAFPRLRYMYGLALSVLRSEIIPARRKWYVPVLLLGYFRFVVVTKHYHNLRVLLESVLPPYIFRRAKEVRDRFKC
jgi:glycosyltransferase involved in cell wall biosynthesis